MYIIVAGRKYNVVAGTVQSVIRSVLALCPSVTLKERYERLAPP